MKHSCQKQLATKTVIIISSSAVVVSAAMGAAIAVSKGSGFINTLDWVENVSSWLVLCCCCALIWQCLLSMPMLQSLIGLLKILFDSSTQLLFCFNRQSAQNEAIHFKLKFYDIEYKTLSILKTGFFMAETVRHPFMSCFFIKFVIKDNK